MTVQAQIDQLNSLLAKCYDAEKGYELAAEKVNEPQLKRRLTNLSKQRNTFGHQIKSEIKLLGGDVQHGDTLAAKLHRTWMELRTALTNATEEVILTEVIRGEKNAVKYYDEALEKFEPYQPAFTTIQHQRSQINDSLATMTVLEDAVS